MIDLIYCAAGNPRMLEIAIEHGFGYGVQIGDTAYPDIAPVQFLDQDWRNPSLDLCNMAWRQYKPPLATVLDWEYPDQLPTVLAWAETAAAYADCVIVIPKVFGGIPSIPARIGGKPIRLGYSVPTKYGGTSVPVWEFGDRPVHLLGGSPHAQMRLTGYLNVVSADSNYMLKMATQLCQFWTPGNARYAKNRYWPTLKEANGERWGQDAPYEAFRRSCENIMKGWKEWYS